MLKKYSLFWIVILVLFGATQAKAQEDSSTSDFFTQEIVVRSPYVFEGTVTQSHNFWLGKQIVGRYMVQVHKSFKGDVGSFFVDVLAGPDTSGIEDTITHQKRHMMLTGDDHYTQGQTAVFICKDVISDKPISVRMQTPLVQGVTAFVYTLDNSFSSTTAAATACIQNKCKSFNSISSLYRYLGRLPGVHRVDIDKKYFEKAGGGVNMRNGGY